ncbi:hypothetical protein [Limnospira fusiformis]|uniref:hypothetical protein n=1 Tax=Limnospira fusiformis TaxID=54297 RepID=UPI000A6B88E2|nr:hypothetical protein [Limnospira fusiformis LS22]
MHFSGKMSRVLGSPSRFPTDPNNSRKSPIIDDFRRSGTVIFPAGSLRFAYFMSR